jgi:hypothetical protein
VSLNHSQSRIRKLKCHWRVFHFWVQHIKNLGYKKTWQCPLCWVFHDQPVNSFMHFNATFRITSKTLNFKHWQFVFTKTVHGSFSQWQSTANFEPWTVLVKTNCQCLKFKVFEVIRNVAWKCIKLLTGWSWNTQHNGHCQVFLYPRFLICWTQKWKTLQWHFSFLILLWLWFSDTLSYW